MENKVLLAMKPRQMEVGDVVELSDGMVWKVEMVNDCRARLSCKTKKVKEFKDHLNDKMVKMDVPMRDMNISPYSAHKKVGWEAPTAEEEQATQQFLDTIRIRVPVAGKPPVRRKPLKEESKK